MRYWTARNTGTAEPSPLLSELTAFLKEIPAPIGRFDAVTDRMGQGHLADLTREVGLLGCPVRKGAAEAVNRGLNGHFPWSSLSIVLIA